MDFTAAMLALLILSPIFIVVAILVAVKLGTPVFFTQDRPGKNGKVFKMMKFRSMTNDKDENGNLLANHLRLTPFGRWIRSTSLDELPGLINVLKGDMSLVGPRPLRVHYLPLYSEFENRRHEVKPGITGWAQVNGRNAISWEEKFKLDVWYVDHQSLLLDIKILFLTVLKVVKRDGITHEDDAAMPEFKGHNTQA